MSTETTTLDSEIQFGQMLIPILDIIFPRIPKHNLDLIIKITKVALLSYYPFSQF